MSKQKRKKQTFKPKEAAGLEDPRAKEVEVRPVRRHFLDSGAFTLWTTAAKYAKDNKCGRWDYYDTPEFFSYMDDYANFIKKYAAGITHYANVDVIPDFHEDRKDPRPPELTWRNQKYLEEEHGLTPVPVIHFKLDENVWLKKYMDAGYTFIGLGGLVGQQGKAKEWIERCFRLVCQPPDFLPRVKLHGFGVTSYELMIRFPWYSVDSTSWTKKAAYGYLMVPHKRNGVFVFDEQPYTITISDQMLEPPPEGSVRARKALFEEYETNARQQANVPDPYHSLSPAKKQIVHEWLDHLGIPLGKRNAQGEITEYGVLTRHVERRAANLLFYEAMRKSLPEYPWPFRSVKRRDLGL